MTQEEKDKSVALFDKEVESFCKETFIKDEETKGLIFCCARHFADWQKQRMMKYAVKGGYIKRNRYTRTNVLHGFSNVCDAIQKLKDNDKVIIIIIKDDE